MKKKNDVWELIGYVGVDSGQILVCDPCYIDSQWKEEEFNGEKAKQSFSYNACAEKTLGEKHAGQLHFNAGHPGVGVVAESGCGDGYYPVYARRSVISGFGKRIVELRVVFEEEGHEKVV